jgi:ligand-binding SRPBCC domain-containing protein
MATYERETVVAAPFEDVWRFHSTVAGLEALTPAWMRLRVESVTGPDGEPLPEGATLDAGSEIRMSVRPFGVGPRQSWTAVVEARREGEGVAFFRDVARDGPFERWVHSHVFHAEDGGTRVRDRVEYAFPTPAGPLAAALSGPGFDAFFRYRHWKTRSLLESADLTW